MKLADLIIQDYFGFADKSELDLVYNHGIIIADDLFNVGPIIERTFDEVKYILMIWDEQDNQDNISNNIRIIEVLTKKTIDEIQNIDLFSFFTFCRWLKKEVEMVKYMESRLTSPATSAQLNAGLEEFNELGPYIMISDLTNGDVTKIEAVLNTKYSLCYAELLYRHKLAAYDKRLNKI